MLERFIAVFFSIPGAWAIGAVFLVSAAETALFLGILLPGELAVILGGVLASRAEVPLSGVLVAAVAGPIVGDSIGYFIGRRFGERARHTRHRQWARVRDWIKRSGAPAVFAGRFVPYLRSVVPAAAGAVKMPYRHFLPWSVSAGIVWGAGSALLGYFVAAEFESLVGWMNRLGFGLLLAAVAVAAVFLMRRSLARRRGPN